MKRILPVLLIFTLLTGCKSTSNWMDSILMLRKNLMNAESASFLGIVTADYGDKVYEFTLQCEFDREGNMSFTVREPETICGITGRVLGEFGQLQFDEEILAFPVLADDYLSPVSSPWLFMKTLRSGRIESCGDADDGFIVKAYDSFSGQTMQVDILFHQDGSPHFVEFVWDGKRVLSMTVSDFCYL